MTYEKYQIVLTRKAAIGWPIAFLALILWFVLATHHVTQAGDIATSCAGLRAAGVDPQLVFNSDPVKFKRFDRDHDLKACE